MSIVPADQCSITRRSSTRTTTTDAERVRLADLARINDEALVTESPVKSIENELVGVRTVKRGDDRALDRGIQIRAKAEPFHSFQQRLLVSPVTSAASGDTAFLL